MRNRVKKLLKDGKTTVGSWIFTMLPEPARVVANAGFDWVLFDTEHGPYDLETVDRVMRGLKGAKALPFIRVVWNDIGAIKKALDTGAYGVVIPWISGKEDAKKALDYCRYPPEGLRGVAPGRAAGFWGISGAEYLQLANEEIMVILQVETEEAVKNIEDIVSVEGVDVAFIGPTDLSTSMGLKGQPFHHKVVDAMDRVVEACKSAGIAPGIAYGMDVEHINHLISQGFRFVGIGTDTSHLSRGCKDILEKIER